jgi:hypothetical protein
MERCPNCGQTGSIDAIALASGTLGGLRAERCAACESFWLGYPELDGADGVEFLSESARSAAGPSLRNCRCCGANFKALPGFDGVWACEQCRLVVMDEGAYDRLEVPQPQAEEEPGPEAP